jgi:hypothetical protein
LLRFSDARNFGRTATGLLLFAVPVLFTVATLVGPKTDYGNSVNDHRKELANIAAHKGTYLLSGILFLLASVFLVFLAIGLIKLFRGPRGVTLGQVGGALLVLGGMVGAAWYAFGSIEYEMVLHRSNDQLLNSNAAQTVYAHLLHVANNGGSGLPLFILVLLGFVLGVILLGVAVIRTRVVPLWVGILIIISAPVGFLASGKAGETANNVLTLIVLGALGWRVLSMSDEEWDAPLERKKAAPAGPEVPPAPTPAPAA